MQTAVLTQPVIEPPLDDNWRSWIKKNLESNCTIQSIAEEMQRKGFARLKAMTAIYNAQNGREKIYLYDEIGWQRQSVLFTSDRQIYVTHYFDKPRVLLLNNVLSHDECDEVIRQATPKLQTSRGINKQTGSYDIIKDRVSDTAYLDNSNELVKRINQRCSEIMHVPLTHGEELQVVRYLPGGEYKGHHDYFPPEDRGSVTATASGGQRVATLLIYLNHVTKGGSTHFPCAKLRVRPRKGSAVYFHYVNQQGMVDPASLHAGEPLHEGEKWIVTKWMRQRPR